MCKDYKEKGRKSTRVRITVEMGNKEALTLQHYYDLIVLMCREQLDPTISHVSVGGSFAVHLFLKAVRAEVDETHHRRSQFGGTFVVALYT